MASRSGMATLVSRVRLLIDDNWVLRQDSAVGDGSTKVYWLTHKPVSESGGTVSVGGTAQGTAAYTLNRPAGRLELSSAPASSASIVVEYDAAVFSDDEVQAALDRHKAQVFEEELIGVEERSSGGTATYLVFCSRYGDFEETSGGTAVFIIEDSAGSVISSGYSVDYARGVVTFSSSQGGSARYLNGSYYDVCGAAAELLYSWASKLTRTFSFSDGQTKYERAVMVRELREQARVFEAKSWPLYASLERKDESDA